jgi:SPP1 family predicted phage head-tail adaptor
MGLAAGSLNRRGTIQRRTDGETPEGQPIDVWVDVAKVWANVKGQTGMGSITGLQDNVAASINRYSVRIRFRQGIDAGMRWCFNDGNDAPIESNPFDIKHVRMDWEGRDWTDLVCEQGGSQG